MSLVKVVFTKPSTPYREGEGAAFSVQDAKRLVKLGVAVVVGEAESVTPAAVPDVPAGPSLRGDDPAPLAHLGNDESDSAPARPRGRGR